MELLDIPEIQFKHELTSDYPFERIWISCQGLVFERNKSVVNLENVGFMRTVQIITVIKTCSKHLISV